jgi:DNA repair protein RecO
MSYSTYTTEAIVCGTRDRNTTDRSYLLFTRDGGMLYAEARGARREGSKQRYALQDFTRVRISLVRGKAGWRVGSVEALHNYYTQAVDRAARGSVVAVVKMLRRFARGEEPDVSLYEFIDHALGVLSGELAQRSFTERVVQVHILAQLGYVASGLLPESFRSYNLTQLPQAVTPDEEARLDRLIAEGITHSHL